MPNFLETIVAQLKRASGRVVLRQIHGDRFISVTGRELLDQIQLVRLFLRGSGAQPGDRCALLAPNSIRWAAFHLALMAEGAIVVPLYFRQAPPELVAMTKDCRPRLIFAASTILLLSCLSRESVLTLSTDLNKLADEIRLASPNYFLNVPTLLERVRRGVEEAITKRPAVIRSLFSKARAAWQRLHVGRGRVNDTFWLALGRVLIFRKIRDRFGPHLRALICGSAPLAPETQQFFLMLGIPVL